MRLDGRGEPRTAVRISVRELGRQHDRRFVGRDREEALRLGDRAVHRDPRRREPAPATLREQVDVGVHERPVGLEACEQAAEPLRRVGALELDQLREDRLRPAHLVDGGQEVHPGVGLLDPDLADDLHHVPGDALLDREALRRKGRDLGKRLLSKDAGRRSAGRAGIVEQVVVALVSVGRGRRRRFAHEALPETVGNRVDCGVRRGHADRSPGVIRLMDQARTTSARIVSGSLPCRRTSSWNRRMSKADPSRRSRSRRRRWISRRPAR